MIVDSSALFAILEQEPTARGVAEAVQRATSLRISTATWVESSIVALQRSSSSVRQLDDLITELGIELVPVDEGQARVAREAYRRFGRGSGSRARLNFGDCFSYALAITTGEPLLFVGADFTHTDVHSALA